MHPNITAAAQILDGRIVSTKPIGPADAVGSSSAPAGPGPTGEARMTTFKEWAGAGFGAELVRVAPADDPGPSPGKRAVGDGWQSAEVTPGMIEAWSRGRWNVGLRTRAYPAVDVDVDDPATRAVVVQVAERVLGPTPARMRENSPRCALLYRLEGPAFTKSRITFRTPGGAPAAVEVLGDGQQLVVGGTHHSGVVLRWEPRPTAAALAPMDTARRDALLATLREELTKAGCAVEGARAPEARPLASTTSPGAADGWAKDGELALEALRRLDPDLHHDEWVRVGMALHAKEPAPGGPAFQAWDTWSASGQKYPGRRDLERKWASFTTPGGVGFASLLHMAGMNGAAATPATTEHLGTRPATGSTTTTTKLDHPRQTGVPVVAVAFPDADGDLRNGQRLVQRAVGSYLAVHDENGSACRWRRWDGMRWSADATHGLHELAARVARSFFSDAENLTGEAQKEMVKHARQSQRTDRIQAMVWMAAHALPDLKARTGDFDRDPWLLNVENGTLDLRTGKLRPHDPSDRISRLAPVVYDPDARAPRFEPFLEEVLPSPDVRRYIQRAAGYALTGVVREHALFLLVGGGRNGKGVLMRVLLSVLGEYGVTAAPDLLIMKHNDGHPTDIAALDGARFIYASEAPPGRSWNEARLKSLTGGDPVSARRMREDYSTIRMHGKFWVAVNERPHVRSTSNAIWSRLKEVRFPVEFRDADETDPARQHLPVKDPRLDDVLVEERQGILSWMVRGCLEWQQHGLGEPPEVRAATAAYRQDEDRVAPFLAEHPVTEKMRLREYFKTWSGWCAETGETPGSQPAFANALRHRGYEVRPADKNATYVFPRLGG